MLYLELIIACFHSTPAIVVTEIIAVIVGAMVVLFLLLRRWSTPLYMLVFAVLGIPIYFIWIPFSSFLTMDRVWMPPSQLQAIRDAAQNQTKFAAKHARLGSDLSENGPPLLPAKQRSPYTSHIVSNSFDSGSISSFHGADSSRIDDAARNHEVPSSSIDVNSSSNNNDNNNFGSEKFLVPKSPQRIQHK